MGYSEELKAHLASGSTTLARAWSVRRRDGVVLGFTDHDAGITFDGIRFAPETGMTAKALSQSTGLSVDNTEGYGALRSDAISEADILAGRYDGAEVRVWLVNWADPAQRAELFCGTIGEMTRGEGAFTAELRGLSEALGVETGRVYHARCPAVLGDRECGFNTVQAGYRAKVAVESVEDARVFRFADFAGFTDRWFEKGRATVLSGAAKGLVGVVKNDRLLSDGARQVELWQRFGAEVRSGDMIRFEAGCDRRAETCRLKFHNFLNFRGFPHVPGDDWLMSYPVSGQSNTGESLFR
ncbi:DUF2163 domain-containing protein [Thioclava sp. A2]|uniref:DUF2163 domain-containing protein n=1 Tax=Thioclava sp. FCG-A2 TaxID=3080562 RepID=UPI0029546FCA|nr:DUF2163 domain-containing protein [Thioclava sp. A2]MDV7269980.1 DUF2163 domain-containing protein [Thioclava sp. A2]